MTEVCIDEFGPLDRQTSVDIGEQEEDRVTSSRLTHDSVTVTKLVSKGIAKAKNSMTHSEEFDPD